MGFGESIKSLVLFSLKKGFGEVRFEEGKLPFIVNADGKKAKINGVIPLNKEQIGVTKRTFLKGDQYKVSEISGYNLLITDIGAGIMFRQIPIVDRPNSYDPKLEAACLSRRGLILCQYDDQRERTYKTYSIASIASYSRNSNIAVIETSKYFSMKKGISNITYIFRPDIELNTVLRLSDQVTFDVIVCPDCKDSDSALVLNNMAKEKLVIAGTDPELKGCFDTDNIIYGAKEKKKGVTLYPESIIKNLEVEHA